MTFTVVVKNPSDFIGSVIGQSEANTKAILATTIGKVLIIDEAYMLYSGTGSGGGGGADIYKTAVIDTIVAEVQSVPGDDRCVLLLGYESQMVEMFQNVNPGLTRRFPISDAFRFEDFTDSELQEILQFKLRKADLGATPQAISTAIDVLSRLRNGLNFGNGGDVGFRLQIHQYILTRHSHRLKTSSPKPRQTTNLDNRNCRQHKDQLILYLNPKILIQTTIERLVLKPIFRISSKTSLAAKE